MQWWDGWMQRCVHRNTSQPDVQTRVSCEQHQHHTMLSVPMEASESDTDDDTHTSHTHRHHHIRRICCCDAHVRYMTCKRCLLHTSRGTCHVACGMLLMLIACIITYIGIVTLLHTYYTAHVCAHVRVMTHDATPFPDVHVTTQETQTQGMSSHDTQSDAQHHTQTQTQTQMLHTLHTPSHALTSRVVLFFIDGWGMHGMSHIINTHVDMHIPSQHDIHTWMHHNATLYQPHTHEVMDPAASSHVYGLYGVHETDTEARSDATHVRHDVGDSMRYEVRPKGFIRRVMREQGMSCMCLRCDARIAVDVMQFAYVHAHVHTYILHMMA